MHLAAKAGNVEVVTALLDAGANINAQARGSGGTGTPLLVAIRGEKPEVVKLLLARNADVTLADEYGDTVLASLITFGTREQVDAVLAKGVDVNAADQRGGVPLSRAVARDDVELAQHLIAKGASATSVQVDKRTPIFFAKSKAMVQLLLEHGAVLTGTEDNGATLLHEYARSGSVELVRCVWRKALM